jgi:hypothetical protein
MTTDPIPADRLAQIEAREDALAILHGPSKSRGDYCICDRHLSRCGPWADMQSTAFLIGQLREAQAESRRLSTYEPCEPCKADDHDHCTGSCPSLCCALAEAQERVAALEGILRAVGLNGQSGWLPLAAEAVNAVLIMAKDKKLMLGLLADMGACQGAR